MLQTQKFEAISIKKTNKAINPFQPNDAMWRHTFHLSLTSMSFAQ
jgi:hypothetical protein